LNTIEKETSGSEAFTSDKVYKGRKKSDDFAETRDEGDRSTRAAFSYPSRGLFSLVLNFIYHSFLMQNEKRNF
jgi:hypothetical protein